MQVATSAQLFILDEGHDGTPLLISLPWRQAHCAHCHCHWSLCFPQHTCPAHERTHELRISTGVMLRCSPEAREHSNTDCH